MGRRYLLMVMLLALTRGLEAADPMKYIALGFMKVMEECRKELKLDNLFIDLYRYWKLEYSELQRETGCAIICMSTKLELIDETGNIHHGNAKEFAQKNGAGDDIAAKMITIIHDCESEYDGIEDSCLRILEVAKCFRTALHDLKWDPTLDVIVTELLTEI